MPIVDLPWFSAYSQPPEDVPLGQPVPLLLFLHGVGEFGGNTQPQVKRHGPWHDVASLQPAGYHADAIAALRKFHVLGLHGGAHGDWRGDQVNAAIEAFRGLHPELDSERISLTGFSRGGRGVLRTAIYRLQNDLPVHSVAAFCPEVDEPGYDQQQIALLGRIPIYFFHCPQDAVVPYNSTQALQESIGNQSSRLRPIRTDELRWPNSEHLCWSYVYGHPMLYNWLIDPVRWPNLTLPYAPSDAN
jgi:predicted peptidase